MRLRYSSRALSAQAGSLFATARTSSLGTGAAFGGRFRLGFRSGLRFYLYFLAAPEIFQVVKAAHRGMHDVDHDVAQVHQHPFAVAAALDAGDPHPQRLEFFLDADRERVYLAVRIAACDHHALEVRGLAGDVVDHDVAALDVFQRFDHRAFLFADIH